MQDRELVAYIIESMSKKGAQKCQCSLSNKTRYEFNIEHSKIKLLRTTTDSNIHLNAILDHKKGTTVINKKDGDVVDNAVDEVIETARSSRPDPAYDIAEKQETKVFTKGIQEPDKELMFERLNQFLTYAASEYPQTILEEGYLDFGSSNTYFMNSNGVDYTVKKGLYNFSVMFTSKENDNASSFNTTHFSSLSLDKEIKDCGIVDLLLRQSAEQINSRDLPGKFTGDVIITPPCLGSLLYKITGFIGNYSLISGTSIYKDKLEKIIADPAFTLYSQPRSDEIAAGYFVTGDGYEAQNSIIIDKGVLKTFLLSLYGANKTGHKRAVNDGYAFVIEPGTTAFDDMVKSIDRGILLGRFSGGNPAENGDFSGVAKNSFYIENGKIAYPLKETMISGNLVDMLHNIKHISSERINSGSSIMPWMHVDNIVISGK